MSEEYFQLLLSSLGITAGLFIAYYGYKYLLSYLGLGKIEQNNYPVLHPLTKNRVNGEIQFLIEIPEETTIEFAIYSESDKKIAQLHSGKIEEGKHPFLFDAENLEEGKYYYQLKSEHQKNTKTLYIVKE